MKQARTILEYLDRRLGGHSGSGPEYVFHCPECITRRGSEPSSRKFAVNLAKRRGQCFYCKFTFRDISYLFRTLNGGSLTMEERILLREDPPVVLESAKATVKSILYPKQSDREQKLARHRLPPSNKLLVDVPADKMPWKRAHKYLEGRGVTLDDMARFDMGFVPRGRYRGYITFPVKILGETVYWTSRYAGKHPRGIKSQNPKKRDGYYSRQDVLLNFDNVLGEPFVLLVEGPLDTVAPEHGLGVLGSLMSEQQWKLIDVLVEHGLQELCIGLDPGAGSSIDDIRSRAVDRVPAVSTLVFDHGDPDSRRAELAKLIEERETGELSLLQRVQLRLGGK